MNKDEHEEEQDDLETAFVKSLRTIGQNMRRTMVRDSVFLVCV